MARGQVEIRWRPKGTEAATASASARRGGLTLASPAVSHGSAHVSVEAFLAVVAVAAGGVVAAVHAHASALPPRQLVQLHVEAAAASVQVAVAG